MPFPLKPSATQSAFPSRACDVPSIAIPHTGNTQFPLSLMPTWYNSIIRHISKRAAPEVTLATVVEYSQGI